MTLYDIDVQIAELCALLEADPDTGELGAECEEILARLDALSGERTDKLCGLARCKLNVDSEAEALRAEERRLAERRRRLESKSARLLDVLARACGGQRTALPGVGEIRFRRTDRVEVTDADAAAAALTAAGRADLLRTPSVEFDKLEIKRLLKSGVTFPGVALTENVSCFLK
ncbi:MAG: siphovirus Gp157 family protein [Lachnospiraceae bacterium]|nr:siphovirus Gp157 family protein [Lachnospiraceae bacterium]